MFNFFFKSPPTLFEGMTDFHNHLLPGIDDGSKSIEESIKMLELYREMGFEKVIPSPHIYNELYFNTEESIQKSYSALQSNIENSSLKPLMGGFAAEYMIDEFFVKSLDENPSLLTPFKDHILLEIPFFGQLDSIINVTFKLQQLGFTPILAHPERYFSVTNPSDFLSLKDRGILLQLNALSLMGHYGADVSKKAFKLMDLNAYDFVSTDAHHSKHLKILKHLKLTKKNYGQWLEIKDRQKSLIHYLSAL